MNRTRFPAALRQADHMRALPNPHTCDRLTAAIDHAVAESRRAPSGRAVRSDGWTPGRVRIFLEALADCGTVAGAARVTRMSLRGAYARSKRGEAPAFHAAWSAALTSAHRRRAEALTARTRTHIVKPIIRRGVVVGEVHCPANRRDMARLNRLDRQVLRSRRAIVDIVVSDFDAFVDLVCAGGAGADEFIAARRRPGSRREEGSEALVASSPPFSPERSAAG
jgi:hypothetical protein